MFSRRSLVAACVTTAILFSVPAGAKTLIYCSEGSPEGFNPQFYTAGTTFDASSRQIYNRLVEFELGTTKVIPGLADRVPAGGVRALRSTRLPAGRAGTFRLPRWAA